MISRRRITVTAAALAAGVLVFLSGCGKPENAPGSAHRRGSISAPKAKFHTKAPGYTNWWADWSKELYLGGYEKAGKKDAKWDEPVRAALKIHSYSRVYGKPPPGNSLEDVRDHLKEAIDAGCDDPLILYLYHRQFANPPNSANPQVAAEYSRWAQAMDGSGYSSLLKFFVNLRTSQAWLAAFPNQAPEVNQFRRAAMQHLEHALCAEEMPAHAADDACDSLYGGVERNSKQRDDFALGAEGVLLKRWGNEAFPYELKGRFYIDYAWEARGGEWANTVKKEGWKLFAERLKVAEAALAKAWKIDPSFAPTPVQMMRLELGQGRGRQRLETWFERAIKFPQNRYQAVQWKLWYLQPRWYGTEEECLQFARDTLQSNLFVGETPLLLYHTHESLAEYFKDIRPDYWQEVQVWPDIMACFERYFALNGDAGDWRQNYVKCAWRCHQWKVFVEESDKLKSVNYSYFGDESEFKRMKQKARELAAE